MARKEAADARKTKEEAETSIRIVSDSYDEARRRLKQLEDEQSAGYSFRKLTPTCCPACEAAFEKATATVEPSDGTTCALCKNKLAPLADDIEDDSIKLAKEDVDELDASLKVARAKFKAAEKAAKEQTLALATSRLRSRQSRMR